MSDAEISRHLPLPHLPLHVLLALAEEERHGWAVIKRIEELTEGHHSPSSGSLYLAMARLEKAGLIEEVAEPPEHEDSRRRYYRLTGPGRRVLAAEVHRLGQLVDLARTAGIPGGA